MLRLTPPLLWLGLISLAVAAESDPQPLTLADLEAMPFTKPDEANWGASALKRSQAAVALIEQNTLSTADDFFRVSKHLSQVDGRHRSARVRYELLLAAAAMDHHEAAKQLGNAWDDLLTALGRPLRADARGLSRRYPDIYPSDPAPKVVRDVWADPEKVKAEVAATNEEMTAIVKADQADRHGDMNKLTSDERKAMRDRDNERNARTRAIIAEGALHTAADFSNASLVMQHSPLFAGYQTAHELAVCAMLLGDHGRGRWLIAATYDRMLGSVGHDQRFGTQYHGMGGIMTIGTVDEHGICDAERRALGCPSLADARNRNMDPGRAKEAANEARQLLAQFKSENGGIHDPKYGLEATTPDGWELARVLRWGDQQNTLFFEIAAVPGAAPSLYYHVYREPRPMTPDGLVATMHEEVRKKQESRRERLSDYTNREDSFRQFTLEGKVAFSWLADFTNETGEKCTEYLVRVQDENADAMFFVHAPVGQLEALRAPVDAFMAKLTLPRREMALEK